jgi:tripartite-type tricarboxylate transporter receptor subunit TctC
VKTMRAAMKIGALIFSAVAVTAATLAVAQENAQFPTRPITLVVPYPAGGNTDVAARAFAKKMSEFLAQTTIVQTCLPCSSI